MNLIMNIKPTKYVSDNKESLIERYQLYGFCISSQFGQHYYRDDKNYIYVANFQKLNKKTKQVQKVINGKNITTSKIIRKKQWIIFVYRIPKNWLIAANKKVIQKTRNFINTDNKK